MNLMALSALAASLAAAERTGLLYRLGEGSETTEALAGELGLDETATARVLDVLAAWGLVEHRNERWHPSASLARELAGPVGAMRMGWKLWSHTPELLRGGEPLFLERAPVYAGMVSHLTELYGQAPGSLARRLSAEPSQTFLDVGAGAAIWSLEWLKAHPESTLTVFDLEPVLVRAKAAAKTMGVADRLRLHAGTFETLEFAPTFDRVLLANVLHLETPSSARDLIHRATACLRPGGVLVIVDALPSETEERVRAGYALHLALRIEGAYPHAESDVRSWLADAGLDTEPRFKPEGGPAMVGALFAHKKH